MGVSLRCIDMFNILKIETSEILQINRGRIYGVSDAPRTLEESRVS